MAEDSNGSNGHNSDEYPNKSNLRFKVLKLLKEGDITSDEAGILYSRIGEGKNKNEENKYVEPVKQNKESQSDLDKIINDKIKKLDRLTEHLNEIIESQKSSQSSQNYLYEYEREKPKKRNFFFRFAKGISILLFSAIFGFESMLWITLPRIQRATYTFKGYDSIIRATYLDFVEINNSDNTLLKKILEVASPYYQLRDKVIRKFYNVPDDY